MSLSTFVKLVQKAFKFSVSRPIQRFNIYNRMKKYLGPDAKYFMPAPRAIGSLSQLKDRTIQYPHLEGYKSMRQRRLEAMRENEAKRLAEPSSTLSISSADDESSKSSSLTKTDDEFVIKASDKLSVTKTVMTVEPPDAPNSTGPKSLRPLPTSTNLPMQDLSSIWHIENTPEGRLNLNMLQEIMLNHLADENHWTPKAISERHNIKEEYAASLIKYLKQIRIVVSPRMMKTLDYVGRSDPHYQAAKHLIYFVDKSMRTDIDKKYDKMYLPDDDLDDEIKELLDQPEHQVVESKPQAEFKKLYKRPEPLRLAPLNKPKPRSRRLEESPMRIEAPKEVKSNGTS